MQVASIFNKTIRNDKLLVKKKLMVDLLYEWVKNKKKKKNI